MVQKKLQILIINNRFKVLSFITLCFFLSCKNAAKKNTTSSKEIIFPYEWGNITKTYNENNNLVKEQEFKKINNKLTVTGYCKKYYDNGKLKELAFYKNDSLDSVRLLYYPNGKLKARYYRLDCNTWGLQKEYDSLGDLHDAYFLTYGGKSIFYIEFNEGKLKEIDGIPIHLESNNNPIHVDENFIMANHVVVLKNFETILSIKLFKGQKLLCDTTINKFKYYLNSNYYFFRYNFNEIGIYRYNANVKLIDSISHSIIKNYTSNIKIEVIK